MSINFGYGAYGGYGMMNGMNMMGGNIGGNTYQSFANQYSCPMCYQYGPVPYNYQAYVNPLPPETVNPSWISRMIRKFTGG